MQLRHDRDPTSTTTIAREVQRNARPETDGSASILASQLDTVETGCRWLLPSDGNHQPQMNAGNGAPDAPEMPAVFSNSVTEVLG